MKLALSRPARLFLVRGLFAVLALGALYGIWDNREFITRYPFYILAVVDLGLAVLFGYLAATFPQQKCKKFLLPALIAYGVFIVGLNLISSWLHASALGFANVAAAESLTVPLYIFQEVLYLAILPVIVVIAMVWMVRKWGR